MEKLREINILYEDNHLLVVEKPVNMPVCEDASGDIDLLSILKDYLKEKYHKPGNVYLGLVHRLDRPVSGVMVFAKTSKAAGRLSAQISEKKMKKVYVAVVSGKVPKSGEWTDYLGKDKRLNKAFVTDSRNGKESKLRFERLDYKEGLSLVKVYLETGRSHQIRVQFSSRGFPLVGDVKYNDKIDRKAKSVALLAKRLEFCHPVTKEVMEFELDMPKRYPFNLF